MKRYFAKKFIHREDGVVLVETLFALPVLILISLTFLEFGNMMWQRQQLQTGVKDAARYWARCRPTTGTGTAFMTCSIPQARNIAFTGDPTGTAPYRVPGWDDVTELTIEPATPPVSPSSNDFVLVRAEVPYQASALFQRVIGSNVTIGYYHTTRYVGW